jgi:DnaJ-class molecular chaperone
MLDEYYQILEVPLSASRHEIKRAYWRLAKKWHPDVNPSEEAQVQFIRINQAYEILANGKLPPKPVVYTPSYADSQEE